MLRRFKAKIKRTASPSNSPLPSTSEDADEFPSLTLQTPHEDIPVKETLGLLRLFPHNNDCESENENESQPDMPAPQSYPVDIIAVHGLGGNAYKTWTHNPDKTLWLRDLLPKSLPGCRVYTYGYPSSVFSESTARVNEFARVLLVKIRDLRERGDSNTGQRPIIFVCHSLGGIVFKQALVLAHQEEKYYGEVLSCVAGVAFLGTPHKGSRLASYGTILATITNAFTTTTTAGLSSKAARADLLDHLSPHSDELYDLVMAARNRLHNLQVVSFHELNPMPPPLSSIVVDRTSATLGIPNEEVIPMYETHRSICKYPGETESYNMVAHALRRIATKALAGGQTLQRTSTNSSSRTLSEIERTCLRLLRPDGDLDEDDQEPRLAKPIPGTCQWIYTHKSFTYWLENGNNALLWLTGDPGCGKTTLAVSLTQYLEECRGRQIAHNVAVYFCSSKHNKQTDAKAVLMGLIYQILSRHRSLISHVRRVFDIQGQSMVNSSSSLWSIFTSLTKDPKTKPLYVILDALDECESTSCRWLLDSISALLAESSETQVKFFVTSRPFLRSHYVGAIGTTETHVSIDEAQSGYIRDLDTFIQQRIAEISLKRQYPSEVKTYLLEAISAKADQTFLWIHIVLALVEESLLTSLKDFRNIIAGIPDKLAETYMRYLSVVPSDHQVIASHLLKLLLASSRPLHLDELNAALTINSSHTTVEDVAEESHTAMAHTVQGILGPLARLYGSKVSLVHQSLKEYLLDKGNTSGSFCATYSVNEQDSALQMACACIRYLCLEDFDFDFFSTNDSSLVGMAGLHGELPTFGLSDDDSQDETHNLHSDLLFRDPAVLNQEVCRMLAGTYGFYSYASLHWTEHFALCEDVASDDIRDAALQLLDAENACCRNWLHFYDAHSVDSSTERLIGQHPVVLAAYFGLHSTLKSQLASSNAPQATKNRGLFWSSQRGHERITSTLLAVGADPNSRELDQQIALTVASEHGHHATVVALLTDKRTDINAPGRKGRSALSFACGNGHDRIMKELLARGCDANHTDYSKTTPFIWAVGGGHRTIISALAKQKNRVNINHQDKEGRTAVSWAAGDGMDDVLQHLLKLPGIDVNILDNKGKSPLSWAAGNGCANAIAVLLRNPGIDVMSLDKDNRNAISWACQDGHHDALVRLLDRMKSAADSEDVSGWTPLAWAIQNDAPRTVRALITSGCVDIERRDHGGRTALYWAVEYGHAPVVKVLLEEGANPEARNSWGDTPIAMAQRSERADLQELLSDFLRKGSV